jgi:aspartyl-tRNA(Asn)/glutamyl-tRNA(Gln) amidotransferase subunit A
VGPVARTVLDAALLHDVIAGHDALDSTSLDHRWPSMAQAAKAGLEDDALKGLRVGVVKEISGTGEGFQPGVKQRFDETVALLTAAGAEVVEVSAPSFEYAVAAYYLILPAEASSNLARFDSVRFGLRVAPQSGPVTSERVMAATRDAGFGPEVKRRIMLGTYALSAGYYEAYYAKAQRVRTLIRRDFERAFAEVDALVAPTAPTPAFKLGEKTEDPLAMYLNDVFTIPQPLAGVPALSVPCGFSTDGLPIGLQLIGRPFDEATLFQLGAAYEAETDWRRRKPALDHA